MNATHEKEMPVNRRDFQNIFTRGCAFPTLSLGAYVYSHFSLLSLQCAAVVVLKGAYESEDAWAARSIICMFSKALQ